HPVEDRSAGGSDVLRRVRARWLTLRGRPPVRVEAAAEAGGGPRLHVLRRAGARVLLLSEPRRSEVPGPGELLRRDPARPGHRLAEADRRLPRGDGYPGGVRAPRGGSVTARDRP